MNHNVLFAIKFIYYFVTEHHETWRFVILSIRKGKNVPDPVGKLNSNLSRSYIKTKKLKKKKDFYLIFCVILSLNI